MCLFVGLLVCWSAFYRPHDICPLCGAASEWPREQEPSSRAARRERASMRAQQEHARACRTTSLRKIRCADAFQKQIRTRARACCRIRNCRDFQKKGKRKPTCHFPSSVYSLPSLGVFTFRIVLNRILHKSSLLAPMHGITENQATYLHCGGEARAKKRARPPATCRKASTGKTGADTGPEGCGSPAVFPSPCLDLQRLQS